MTAGALLEDLHRRGAAVSVTPAGKLRIVPAALLDPVLLADLKTHRDAIVAELTRRQEQAEEKLSLVDDAPKDGPRKPQVKRTRRGVLCSSCQRIDLAYEVRTGVYVCGACLEWRIAGCLHFTILHGADEAEAAKRGCCLACGASIELHGRPNFAAWRRVDSLDDVHLAEVRFVLASAASIAKAGRASWEPFSE